MRWGVPPKFKVASGGVSLPAEIRREGNARAKALGFRSFSAYVQVLIQNDCRAPDAPLVIYAPAKLKR